MNRFFLMVLIAVSGACSSPGQLLLSQNQSYTYEFSGLLDFGDGYPAPNPRGLATFYTDPAQSTPGATYRIELFENNTSEAAMATINGSGNLTAIAVNGWQDQAGAARVTVTSGGVFFEALRVSTYIPDGGGTYHVYTSDLVPVPEPKSATFMAMGVLALLGWTLKRRRR